MNKEMSISYPEVKDVYEIEMENITIAVPMKNVVEPS